jgi:hypothetical protein
LTIQIPNFRAVRVALGTGYNRVKGNRRASRNGLVTPPSPASEEPLHHQAPRLPQTALLAMLAPLPPPHQRSLSARLGDAKSDARSSLGHQGCREAVCGAGRGSASFGKAKTGTCLGPESPDFLRLKPSLLRPKPLCRFGQVRPGGLRCPPRPRRRGAPRARTRPARR